MENMIHTNPFRIRTMSGEDITDRFEWWRTESTGDWWALAKESIVLNGRALLAGDTVGPFRVEVSR